MAEDEADDERPYTQADFDRIRQNVDEWDADFDPSLDPIGAMGGDDGERSVVAGSSGGVDAPHVEDLVSWTPQEKAYRESMKTTILNGLIGDRNRAEQNYRAAVEAHDAAAETAAMGEIVRLNQDIQWRETVLTRQLEQKLTGMSFDDDVSYSATPQETAALHNAAVTQLARGDYDYDPETAAAIDAWRQQMAGELRDAGHRSCEEEPNQPGCGSANRAGYFGYFASHDPAV